jgi:hypothetical protein
LQALIPPAGLVPRPSLLQPHCHAHERALLWVPSLSLLPLDANGRPLPALLADLEQARCVANTSIAIGTRRLYGSGILVFNVYCDRIGVDNYGRIPASNAIMLGFVASLAGSYSQGTISSYVSGVRFWHQVHGIDWLGVDAHINREIHGTGEHAPEKSKRKLCLPVLPAHLVAIQQQLDLTSPLDAAVWACACCTFWAVARLGELVVRRLPGFDPAIHPACRHVTLNQLDRSGHNVNIIHLPSTKTHQNEGEDIYRSTHVRLLPM